MMRFIYNAGILILFPLIVVFLMLKYRVRFFKHFLNGVSQRLGSIPHDKDRGESQPVIWLHAASIGELNLLKPLIQSLKTRFLNHRIYISTVTPEALQVAKTSRIGDYVFLAPIDFGPFTRKVVRKVKPKLLLLAESEFWPNLIVESKKIGAVVGVVNTRVSDKAFYWLKLFRWWYAYVLSYIDFFCVRETEDEKRIIALGVKKDRVILTGNLKYDSISVSQSHPAELDALYKKFKLKSDDKILVCGSVHPGEIELILKACREVQKEIHSFKLIIAPRHIDKINQLESVFRKARMRMRLFSRSSITGEDHTAPFLILDTVGDLIPAYRIAQVVFVGGSLVPKGGQNIIEPALLEKPVVFGKFMDNFKESTRELLRCGGGMQVQNDTELAHTLIQLFSDVTMRTSMGRRAQAAAVGLKGATHATVRIITQWFDAGF